MRDAGWSELRPIQVRAIGAVLGHDRDVVISASTAAGKTEAVFLPLLTRAADKGPGLSVLYISPLKALINDQARRLDLLCERLELPVVRWHGDAPQGPKRRMRTAPKGVVLITPESIEALFLRRTDEIARLFGGVDAVVIDELHAFLTGPRGLHLFSLLRRIDQAVGRRLRRIGLSATLGDAASAVAWLNPEAPGTVDCLEETGGAPELRLQVRGYVQPQDVHDGQDELQVDGGDDALEAIVDHAFSVLRGDNHLVFAGSRRNVEAVADRLRQRSEAIGVPNEFFPHHGSLSKELREDLETRLKAGVLPTTAVATTTLELGIDLGAVKSVAQLGAPRSLAGLRQRLGRSGRRAGAPAVLRVYVRERHLGHATDVLDRLRAETVRAVAAVDLLLARYIEPPAQDASLVTVVIHQLLSLIAERGGVRPDTAYGVLCGAGPMAGLEKADFVALLRHLASPDVALIEQAPDGALMLGPAGEALTAAREFYAVFETDQEWKLVHGARALGQIPISNVLAVGSLLAFAGRRWRVVDVDDRAKVLGVAPHPAGKLPKFDRQSTEPMDDRLLEEMRAVYLSDTTPAWLDAPSLALLDEGRDAFADLGLGATALLSSGNDTHVLTWRGSRMNDVLSVAFLSAGFICETHDLGVTVAQADRAAVQAALYEFGLGVSSGDLSAFVANLRHAKYDAYAPDALLRRLWARRHQRECDQLGLLAASLAV